MNEHKQEVNYWLFKSEPSTWSWQDQVAVGARGEEWDGVRNFQARNNMLAMKVGDCGFFYHSQTDKQIVGIVKIISAAHPDTTDTTGKWSCVDIVAVKPLTRPISLATIKQNPLLDDMVLVRNSRLSVQPVTKEQWRIILALSLTS